MCGIFGWWLKDDAMTPTQRAVLATLLADANLSRGRDSWGFYRPEGDVLERGLGSIMRGAVLTLAQSPLVLAHTRSATTGQVTIENAHPYDFGTVVGAHNGMVHNHDHLNAEYSRDFAVDSMHIFAHIAAGLPLEEISAWGAVEYYRRDKARLYLAMFGGTLSVFGLGEPCKGVIWSSSEYALEGALETARLAHYYPFDIKDGQLYCIKNYMLYQTGPFDIVRTYDLTAHYRRNRYDHTQHTRQVGAVIGRTYVPATQPKLPVVTPKSNGRDARKPWVSKLPNESRKQFKRRRRELIGRWEAAQAEAAKRSDSEVDDELVAEVVQEAVGALKEQRQAACAIEGGVVIVTSDPCV